MGFISDSEQKRIFSDNLKRYIIMTGKDQKDVAIELDVNPPTFNQWVNGKAIPSVSTLKSLAAYFQITLSQLVDSPERTIYEQSKLSDKEHAIISAYRKADKGIKTAIDKLLEVDEELEHLYSMGELKKQMDIVADKIASLDDPKEDKL